MNNTNIGVVMAAGVGVRFQNETPKQFNTIMGKEVIGYVLDAFRASEKMDKLLVVLSAEEYDKGNVGKKYEVETICGGETRTQSFYNALKFIADKYPECKKVIFHDAARPLIKTEVFDQYFELLDEYDYVCTCQKITDSLGSTKPEMPNREDFFLMQTPEAYRFRLLYENYGIAIGEMKNFDATYALPKNSKGYYCFDLHNNFKITYPEDLEFVEKWIQFRRGC